MVAQRALLEEPLQARVVRTQLESAVQQVGAKRLEKSGAY